LTGVADEDERLENMHRARYISAMVLVASGALAIIHYFGHRFTVMIDFATTVSFLAAPVLAWLSLKLLTGPHTPAEHQPGPGLRALAWAGLWFLVVFCLIWAGWRLFG
jgi:Mn2+/Fe2+ NRAMP family transporter